MRMWQRLALLMGLTTVGSLVVLGVVVTMTSVRAIQEELDRRALAGAQLVARQLEDVITAAEYAGNTITVVANDAIRRAAEAETLRLDARRDLENQLSFTLSVFPTVAHVWLVLPRDVVGSGRLAGSDALVRTRAEEALPSDDPMGPSVRIPERNAQIGAARLTVAKRVISLATGEPIAALLVALDDESFRYALQRPEAELGTRFRITDEEGVLVDGASDARAGSGDSAGVTDRAGTAGDELDFTEFSAPLDGVPWNAVSSVPQRAVRAYTIRIVILSGLLVSVVSVIAIASALAIARSVTRPLEELERQMRGVDVESGTGELQVAGNWEVQRVTLGANRLLQRVHALVERVAREERDRQRYHLELLQAQIKPHFLYNSLELIHMLGESGRMRRAQRALRTLSDFYRLSLSAGEDLVSLATELAITEHYLEIQHMRYEDQFTFVVRSTVPPEANILIPKLTVQPLVENALYHGIKGLGRSATIEVAATPGETGWSLTVRDTGRGMTPDELRALQSGESTGSFGYRSVVERLRLHLGTGVGVDISSQPDVGTTVDITLPYASAT